MQGAVSALTAEEYAKLEKTHLCCTAAAVSDDREPLLPHWQWKGADTVEQAPVFDFKITFRAGFQADNWTRGI